MATMLLYSNGYGSQFIDDYIAGIIRFDAEGWAGFADSYDFPSLYYGHNIVFYGFYSLFGSSALAWFLLFTGLHSLNAVLGFGFIKRIFNNNNFPAASSGALLASLLFLVSPYQTENVIWGATLHYAVAMLCMWGIAWLYAGYLDTGKSWKLWAGYALFAFSLLTLEISLVFPGIFLLLFGWLWQPFKGPSSLLKHTFTIVVPMAAIIALYFVATYSLKGHVIGHYGDDHLQFSITQIVGTFWQYMAKLLAQIHFLPYANTEFVYQHLADARVTFGLLAIAIAAWFLFWRYHKAYAWFALGWLGLVFIALLPVLNMYFMYLMQGENDRLSYFAAVFVYAIPVLLFMWFAVRWLWVFGTVAMVGFVLLLYPHTIKWEHATTVQERSVDSPLFYGTAGKIYLLNLPCYYDGIYVYRGYNRFQWARKYYRLPDIDHQLRYVLSANLQKPTDGATGEELEAPNTFKVELNAWGIWFWNNKRGAQNRTEEDFTITLDEWGHSYIIHLPDLQPADRLLYYTPDGWQEIKRTY